MQTFNARLCLVTGVKLLNRSLPKVLIIDHSSGLTGSNLLEHEIAFFLLFLQEINSLIYSNVTHLTEIKIDESQGLERKK